MISVVSFKPSIDLSIETCTDYQLTFSLLKFQQSDDCIDIEKLLVTLTKIQFTHSRELLELIDPDMFYEKLFVSSNKEDKLSFLSQLQLMEYPYINQLEKQLLGANNES